MPQPQPDIGRGGAHAAALGQGERGGAERRRIQPQDEVMHDGIPDDDHVVDMVAGRRRLLAQLADQLLERSRTASVSAAAPPGFIMT